MNFDIKQIRKEVEYIFNSYPRHDMISMSKAQACWLIERVESLENRNKELEYASKHNGELNEFLQKRKLPPNTLGRHVVDVVMDYVEELEKERIERDIVRKSRSKLENQTIQLNRRYRKTIESMKSEINYVLYSHKSKEVKRYYLENAVRYADEALEGDCIHCNGKGFNGLDYCPQCNQMEEDDDN